MGYMDGGTLPFDINDFLAVSPKRSEAQAIQVINSQSIQSKDSGESTIDDFFKTIMPENYTREPQPVPPVPSPSASSNYQNYTSGYNPYNQFNSPPTPLPHSSSMFTGPPHPYPIPHQNNRYNGPIPGPYSTNTNTNSYANSTIPPPLPPPFNSSSSNVGDEYNPDSWEMNMSWNTTRDSSFNHSLDAPRSPPHYERKGLNTNVIEYIDPSINENPLTGSADVDHRQLLLPLSGPNALGKSAKDRGRLMDVDHRNLISLTGSPKTDKEISTNAMVHEANSSGRDDPVSSIRLSIDFDLNNNNSHGNY